MLFLETYMDLTFVEFCLNSILADLLFVDISTSIQPIFTSTDLRTPGSDQELMILQRLWQTRSKSQFFV